jgi:quercetin dioxygenase-like cupin family protein
MRTTSILLAFIAFAAVPALAQDPVTVDSAHYKVQFQNDHVRVLRITYGPNDKSVMHYHPAGVVVFLTDARGQHTLPNGETVQVEGKAGQTGWAVAGSHIGQNLSNRPFELILIELKTLQPGMR